MQVELFSCCSFIFGETLFDSCVIRKAYGRWANFVWRPSSAISIETGAGSTELQMVQFASSDCGLLRLKYQLLRGAASSTWLIVIPMFVRPCNIHLSLIKFSSRELQFFEYQKILSPPQKDKFQGRKFLSQNDSYPWQVIIPWQVSTRWNFRLTSSQTSDLLSNDMLVLHHWRKNLMQKLTSLSKMWRWGFEVRVEGGRLALPASFHP